MDQGSVEKLVEQWAEATSQHGEEQSPIPIKVLLGETVDLAALVDSHFQPKKLKARELPGLEVVGGAANITAATSRELRELGLVISSVHSRVTLLIEKLDQEPIERGEYLEVELRSALGFVLEDGSHEKGEQQLARLRVEHTPIASHDGLALALDGYAALADEYRELLTAIDFPIDSIAEARAVAQRLRERSAVRLTGAVVEEQRTLLSLRNRLTAALLERIRNTRRTFRYVFRDHPDIARKAGSEYERNRRRQYREAAAELVANATTPGLGPVSVASGEVTD